MFKKVANLLGILVALAGVSLLGPNLTHAQDRYKKSDVAEARLGSREKRKLLGRIDGLPKRLADEVIGQGTVVRALAVRLRQYVENLGSRDRDPVAAILAGLPGLGKTDLLTTLSFIGFKTFKVDAQALKDWDKAWGARRQLQEDLKAAERWSVAGVPVIFAIEELDKIPELTREQGDPQKALEQTHPLVGFLNEILTDGVGKIDGETAKLSNVFFLGTMNLPSTALEQYRAEVLRSEGEAALPKTFYDFTPEDLNRFHQWMMTQQGCAKILGQLYRSNTVSRMAHHTLVLKPLTREEYEALTVRQIKKTLAKYRLSLRDKRIEAKFTPAFARYLSEISLYAPSGARQTVSRVNALLEQLLSFGARLDVGDVSLGQPRRVDLDAASDGLGVELTVTPRKRLGPKAWREGESRTIRVTYDQAISAFETPDGLARKVPKFQTKRRGKKGITQGEILMARFISESNVRELPDSIGQDLFGMETMIRDVSQRVVAFLGAQQGQHKTSEFFVMGVFSGTAKSEVAKRVAKFFQVPLVRINLQTMSSQDDGVRDLLLNLEYQLNAARLANPSGPVFVLIDELDKLHEINAATGEVIARPALAIIKDLITEGVVDRTVQVGFDAHRVRLDFRGVFTFITMNAGADQFGFKPDPRLTTVADMERAYRRMRESPEILKEMLKGLFLPDTVDRLMPYFYLVPPTSDEAHEKIIQRTVRQVLRSRSRDGLDRDVAKVKVQFRGGYAEFLRRECVVPSEGARNTEIKARHKFATHLELAIQAIPKSSRMAVEPVTLVFDLDPATSMLSVEGESVGAGGRRKILEVPVVPEFPPLGRPGKVTLDEVVVAIHEFFHARAAQMLGVRFETLRASGPQRGYVKLADNQDLQNNRMIFQILIDVAARAGERVLGVEDPLAKESIAAASVGSRGDIQNATQRLWEYLFKLGGDPWGGNVERTGSQGDRRFAELPDGKVNAIAEVLRDLEEYWVKLFKGDRPAEWYVEKVAEVAHAGEMSEREFYELVGEDLRARGDQSIGRFPRIAQLFADHVQPRGVPASRAVDRARESAIHAFHASVRKRLHPDLGPGSTSPCDGPLQQ